MSEKRTELLSIIDSTLESPSLIYWNSLLNFFNYNIKTLDLHDVEILCTECERCRLYWNTDNVEIVTIRRSGEDIEHKQIKKGLDIKKEEVYPKIYDHLIKLQREEEEDVEIHEEPKHTTKYSPDVVPMTASAKD